MEQLATRLFDSHCHIYPDQIALKAVYSIDRFYGGLPAQPKDGTTKTLLETGRACRISHFIVHSVATKPEQVSHINQFIARSVAAAKGAFTGLGTMHPFSEHLEQDLEELCALGLSGVKLHPDIQRFYANEPKAMQIFALCEQKGLPVLVHTGDYRYDYSNPSRIIPVLQAFPKLTFVGAHLGGWSVWDEATKKLPDYPNMMVDTSSSFYWLSKEKAREVIRAYGAKRVMFGTDYPMWDQKPELEYLAGLKLEQEEYEDICWRTCAGVYNISAFAAST